MVAIVNMLKTIYISQLLAIAKIQSLKIQNILGTFNIANSQHATRRIV